MRKIGLVLGSGAAWGLAHVGVLEILEREGIRIDMIAGTSAGALIGALYARGKSVREIKEITSSLSWLRLIPLVDPILPRTALLGGRRITTWLQHVIERDTKFADLQIPFACAATDIMTGEEVVMNEGLVLEAVRASISIPGLFTAVRRGNRYLVDGSLTNAVPVSIARNMGADFIIAVNVLSAVTRSPLTAPSNRHSKKGLQEPNIIEVLMRSLYIGVHRMAKADLKDADFVIEPDTGQIGPGDFHRAPEAILRGELAAQDAIPRLRQTLAGLGMGRTPGTEREIPHAP